MQPLNLQNLWFYLGKTTISTKTRFSIKIVKNQFSHHFCLPNASETCSWSIFGALLASLGLPWVPFWLPEGALWASRGRPRPHLGLQTLCYVMLCYVQIAEFTKFTTFYSRRTPKSMVSPQSNNDFHKKKDLPIPNCPVAVSGVSPLDTIIQ